MSTELVIIKAESREALAVRLQRIIGFLDRVPVSRLEDIAFTCAHDTGPAVLALVTDSVADLRMRLMSAKSRLENPATKRLRDKSGTYFFGEALLGEGHGRLAYVYPGVMSFYPDMMRDLAYLYPECRSSFDELEEALQSERGEFIPSGFIFPPAPYYRHDAERFSSGAYAQSLVATYAGCSAMTRLLAFFGVNPEGVVGMAGGDLGAMIVSGAAGRIPFRPERLAVVREIYRIVHRAVDHAGLPEATMISVMMKDAETVQRVVESLPADAIHLVMDMSSRQRIYALAPAATDLALTRFAEAGVKVLRMPLNRPFNTPLVAQLLPELRKFVSSWMRFEPVVPVYSCASATRVPPGLRAAREDTVGRWVQPIRFRETVRRMYDEGYRVFLEVGPRGMMTACVDDILKGENYAAIAVNSIHRRGLLQLQHALAQLAALGCAVDIAPDLRRRGARKVDFDSAFASGDRQEHELKLSRHFPRLTLVSPEELLPAVSPLAEPKGRIAKVAARAAAVAAQARRQRQFEAGALNPLISDADTIEQSPGVSMEIEKTFRLSEFPFLEDSAIGTSQLSYSDPNLRGLILLTLPVAMEMMAELASQLAPNRELSAVEGLQIRRGMQFRNGQLPLRLRAERIASGDPALMAIRVTARPPELGGESYTWPNVEGVFIFAHELPAPVPVHPESVLKPRSVHWAGRDIYPARLSYGSRLRTIDFVETWSETGLDYELTVPKQAGAVSHALFPLWQVNPLLLEAIVGGFKLWRSHERFSGATSVPFRLRRLEFHAPPPKEDQKLRCYMRLTGVTPKSQLCDIIVSDGNGQAIMTLGGWEEYTQRVPPEYQTLVMQPATSFITKTFTDDLMGHPAMKVSSSFVTGIPYALFERDEEMWLRTFAHIVLSDIERRDFQKKTGSTARRTEWLFGRIAAKEAVRRFLKDNYQARWSYADVTICADDMGKPYAIGAWSDFLPSRLDIAISHTAQFVTAACAAGARIGIDVESAARDLSEDFTAGVFNPEELELAAHAVNASQAIIRFWCAKEAVSKALGVGIRYSPKDMRVSGYDVDTGKLQMRLYGGWVENFPGFKGRDIEVTVRTMQDHALAFCFIPSMLFPHD